MKSIEKNKVALTAIAVFVMVIFLYNLFFKQPVVDVPAIAEDGTPIDAVSVGDDLLEINGRLQRVSLERGLFTSAAYQSLMDFSTEIPTQATGRANPFNPIGRD